MVIRSDSNHHRLCAWASFKPFQMGCGGSKAVDDGVGVDLAERAEKVRHYASLLHLTPMPHVSREHYASKAPGRLNLGRGARAGQLTHRVRRSWLFFHPSLAMGWMVAVECAEPGTLRGVRRCGRLVLPCLLLGFTGESNQPTHY